MKNDYNFDKAKRGAVIKNTSAKTRITILVDTDILDEFRKRADKSGQGYQTLINQALREYLENLEPPVSARELREILREELQTYERS